MSHQKFNKVFRKGAISPKFIGKLIASQSSKKDIGAHSIFLGQVRNDVIENKTVVAIEYLAYEKMANEKFYEICQATMEKYTLQSIHIYHSLGKVYSGKICLVVFTSSKHRKNAIAANEYSVERIKAEVPVWGKEVFEDEGYKWKENN